jgi:alanyl-tRNA synthetase
VKNSADIGTAVIVSEASIGTGLRRIDMVVGEVADELVRREHDLLSDLARSFKVNPEQLPERVQALRAQLKEAERDREKLRDQVRTARVGGGDGAGAAGVVKHGRVAYVTETVDATNLDELKAYADRYLEVVKSGIVTVVGGGMFVIKVSNDLASQYDANSLKALFGTGGGRPQLVSGKLTVPPDEAFKRLDEALR